MPALAGYFLLIWRYMKHFIRFMLLLLSFVGAVFWFVSRMEEKVFNLEKTVADMEEGKLPIVRLKNDGVLCDLMHGYVAELDPLEIRENIIAVEEDQGFFAYIDPINVNVKAVRYEIYDTISGEIVGTDDIRAFEKEDEYIVVRIKVKSKLETSREYAVKMTLVDENAGEVYYYYRLKKYADAMLAEKAFFVEDFSKSALEGKIDPYIPYLESTYRGKGTDYAYIDIKDSFYMVAWGDLKPELVSEKELTINEFYSNVMVAKLKYSVRIATGTGEEIYDVVEKFRITMTQTEKHLLNYERYTEARFDPKLASVSNEELKLGLTTTTGTRFFTNPTNSYMAFVRSGKLYYYNLTENTLSTVFTFADGNNSIESTYDRNAIKILNMYPDGDVVFMIYGYMTRGAHEGTTGMALYRYYHGEDRYEELLFVPVARSYSGISSEIGVVNYISKNDIFYFLLSNDLYSYNLATDELQSVIKDMEKDSIVFSVTEGYVSWQ